VDAVRVSPAFAGVVFCGLSSNNNNLFQYPDQDSLIILRFAKSGVSSWTMGLTLLIIYCIIVLEVERKK